AGRAIKQTLARPFWPPGGAAAVPPHTLLAACRGSSFNSLREFLAPDLDRPALTSGSAEVIAGEGANVGYLALQRWGRHAWQFADQRVRAERDATVRLVAIGLGGRFAKNRIEASLAGPGASAEMKALFFG